MKEVEYLLAGDLARARLALDALRSCMNGGAARVKAIVAVEAAIAAMNKALPKLEVDDA